MISIVIPAYNAEATLGRCLDTILAQTYPDFEALVVDDGSADRTLTIAEAYAAKDSRIKPLHKENGGVSSARNLALSKAKGEYIAFCDSDDEVKPDWLKDFASNSNGADIVIQDIDYIYPDGKTETCTLKPDSLTFTCKDVISALHEVGAIGYPVTKLFLKRIITENNLIFPENIHFREDEIFFLQFMEHATKCAYVPKSNYKYYLPQNTKTYKSSFTDATDEIFKSLNKIYNGLIPEEVLRVQAWCVKGACIDRLLAGERISSELLSYYRQVYMGPLKDVERPLLRWIIINSPRLGKLSNLLIRIIHKMSK